MKKNLIYGVIFLFGLFSCNNDEELTVILKQSGNMAVHIVDNEGAPLSDVEISIFLYDQELDVKVTDANGLANFGELQAESYYVRAEVEFEGHVYYITKVVQVISGSSRTIEINVEEYVGTLNITATNYEGPASGKKILAVPERYYHQTNDFATLLEWGIKGTTDDFGKLSMELPAGHYYYVYSYVDEETYDLEYSYNIRKGGEVFATIHVTF